MLNNVLEIARNPKASPKFLDNLIDSYDGDRDLGEALMFNYGLTADQLSKLLGKCSLEMQLLGIGHPNLHPDDQRRIVSSIQSNALRTKAKLILLERKMLDRNILTILCLDPNEVVRNKAQKRLLTT